MPMAAILATMQQQPPAVAGKPLWGRPHVKYLLPVTFGAKGYYSLESHFSIPISAEIRRQTSFSVELLGRYYTAVEFYTPLVARVKQKPLNSS